MKKTIVIINGSGHKGKDTFVAYCQDIKPVMNVSSVDATKIALATTCPSYTIGDEKQPNQLGEKWRKALSDLKKFAIATDDGPYKLMTAKITNFLNDTENCILFVHIREPEEIKRILEHFRCKTVLLHNKNVPDIPSNDSDKNVANFNYDIEIDNSGTLDELREKAKDFMISYT